MTSESTRASPSACDTRDIATSAAPSNLYAQPRAGGDTDRRGSGFLAPRDAYNIVNVDSITDRAFVYAEIEGPVVT